MLWDDTRLKCSVHRGSFIHNSRFEIPFVFQASASHMNLVPLDHGQCLLGTHLGKGLTNLSSSPTLNVGRARLIEGAGNCRAAGEPEPGVKRR